MFIKIDKNRSWTHGSKIYEAGVHEVDETVAHRADTLCKRYGWKWLTIHDEHPSDVTHDPNARAGTLTVADIKLGTAGAEAAKQIEAEAAAAAITQKVEAAAKTDDTPQPFSCEHPGCDATFPTKGARTRHANINHKPEDAEQQATTPENDGTADGGETAAPADDAPQGDDKAADGDDTGNDEEK